MPIQVSVEIMVRWSENLLWFAICDIYIFEEFGRTDTW